MKTMLIDWIKNFFADKPYFKGVVIGISGGKDSLVVAKLCCEALGNDKVFGIMMPNGNQKDISDSIETCKILGIQNMTVNINTAFNGIKSEIEKEIDFSENAKINLPPRLRMATLYAIAACKNFAVANTSNLSEKIVGYSTKWGDGVGDFAPIIDLTKTEVVQLGLELGLPEQLVVKKPQDGLSEQTDEDKLGFTYNDLDLFIRKNKGNSAFKEKILKLYKANKHKHNNIEFFHSELKNFILEKEIHL